MEHRAFPGLDARTSLLGFGCMRFPTLPDKTIDEPAAKAMIDRAWAAGVNYFDTAYFYHDGQSEAFIGRALADKPRESYYLTSKLPTVMVHSLDDAKRIFAEQWARLDRDYLDFYLFHNMDAARWHEMLDTGVVDWYLDLQKQGLFRRLGFSFHGSYEEFKEVLTARHWDVCQIQLNYMDAEEQAGMAGYRLAEELGVPVIVMEPVKGGALAAPPEEVRQLFTAVDPAASPSSWALRWCGSLPNVMTVLSGMSTMEQVEDNLKTFGKLRPMDGAEQAVVAEAARRFRERVRNGCTGCRYCMPCPAGVDIPGWFKVWNEYGVYQNAQRAASKWKELAPQQCVECGACEEQCPQKLDIRGDLKRMREELDRL